MALYEPADWELRAACRGLPTSWFFLPENEYRKNKADERKLEGLRICKTCEVKEDCLAMALESRLEYGIFGGTAGRDRKKLRLYVANS
jgi:WhiB family redox-sensing transcriptional regulator